MKKILNKEDVAFQGEIKSSKRYESINIKDVVFLTNQEFFGHDIKVTTYNNNIQLLHHNRNSSLFTHSVELKTTKNSHQNDQLNQQKKPQKKYTKIFKNKFKVF